MHRLVHIAMQSWLKLNGKLSVWNETTLKRIADAFPWPDYENKTIWTIFLPHAQYILASTKDLTEYKKPQWILLHNVGQCFHIFGKYAEAEQAHRQALRLMEQVLGAEHPSTLSSMNNLAEALREQGKYAKAEQAHRQTLRLTEQVLGAEHPSTLDSMNNIALLLHHKGKYAEAEQAHRQALRLKEQVLGAEHTSTLSSMNNLAIVLPSRASTQRLSRRSVRRCG